METVEISTIDLRLEHTRQRDGDTERRLMSSIVQWGIVDPLWVAPCESGQMLVLLDGFKRYRCARKIGTAIAPVERVGDSVADGVLTLLRRDTARGLTILEQAAMIDELSRQHHMSIYEIAVRLRHSPSWVSMRLGLVEELSDLVREKIMSGAFPARAYMYGIKGFTRVNRIASHRVDSFVAAVSGKGLSTRELFVLSRAYFTGGEMIEQLIAQGQAHAALRLLSGECDGADDAALSDAQKSLIKDLEAVSVAMGRVATHAARVTWDTPSFLQYVNLWSAAILKHCDNFPRVVRELYDRSRPSQCGAGTVCSGDRPQADCATAEC